ncbi:MAG: amidase, partial [Pyrinomonadaceae bacterium]|nr:amidase [Pyrinomonadaceae bacterium]
TVREAARLLEAIAGHDDRDPQWVRGPIAPAPYAAAERAGVALRVVEAAVRESMARKNS